jgi:hypothetical protein
MTPRIWPPTQSQADRAQSKTMTPIQQAAQAPLQEPHVWNTKNLGLRMASDFVSGFCAATMVAPVITVIDKYVTTFQY